MTNFLIRHMVKDSENTSDPAVRNGYGRMAGLVGMEAKKQLNDPFRK